MSEGLTEAILANKGKIRFHTPSHCGETKLFASELDVTELPYTDNLLSPVSYISKIEKFTASAYNAEACFISVQGATHNIFQAIYATKNNGAFLIVGKAHVSVYNAMRIFEQKAYHVDAFMHETLLPSDIKTVIFTSPNYFGKCENLKEHYRFLHKKGITVIVDSAHGSHFTFSPLLPESAVYYSDLTILSLHKTLPVMTGGSILCAKKEFVDKCYLCRKLLHTTSPNFAIICSIENTIKDFSENGQKYYEKCALSIAKFKEEINSPFFVEETDDITRLVLVSPYDGATLYKKLFNAGFCAEIAYENKVVFIVNPYNHMQLTSLAHAVNGIKDLPLYYDNSIIKAHPNPTPIDFSGIPEAVSISESEGRQAYLEVGFYPPGTPFLYPRDTITREYIALLNDKKNDNSIFGLVNGKIYVLK